MIPPGYRTLQNIYDMYKVININNKSTRLNNTYNGAEGNNHYIIFRIITKMQSIPNVD